MLSQEEQNQFLNNRWGFVERVCLWSANNVFNYFPVLDITELLGFAHEGFIHALDNAESSSGSLRNYFFRSTFLFTLGKAIELMDGKCVGKNEMSSFDLQEYFQWFPDNLVNFCDETQSPSCEFTYFIGRDDLKRLYSAINISIEKLFIKYWLYGIDCTTIAAKFSLSKTELQKVLRNISCLLYLSRHALEFDSFLTPIPAHLRKYAFHILVVKYTSRPQKQNQMAKSQKNIFDPKFIRPLYMLKDNFMCHNNSSESR